MRAFPEPFENTDEAYRYTVARILETGGDRGDRTGTGTRSVFSHEIEIDLSDGSLPIVSLKKTGFKDAIAELIWMLSGSNSLIPLLQQGIHIWTDWPLKAYITATGDEVTRDEFEARVLGDAAFAEKWGAIYPCYGTEMRAFQSTGGVPIDQMQQLVDTITSDPNSRRLQWSLWRPEYVTIKGGTGLPPCHCRGALRVFEDTLSLKVGIRSNDVGLGTPYNWVQYGYLLHLLCSITGLKPGRFIVNVDDLHLYSNHIEPIRQILERESRPDPKFQWKRRPSSIDDSLSVDDFEVVGYQPQGFIKLPVAV